MRIVVVGGSGLIGDEVMSTLHETGHKPVAASPAFEIDAFTGEGLDEAIIGADVVLDVSNAPAWRDEKVLEFFTTSTRNAWRPVDEPARATTCALSPRVRPVAGERLPARQGRAGGADPRRPAAIHDRVLNAIHGVCLAATHQGRGGVARRALRTTWSRTTMATNSIARKKASA
jgi:hypothetical protein